MFLYLITAHIINFEVGGISVDVISVRPNELGANLKSRDFTINAIAQSVTGQFFDPTRGLDDVKSKTLRTPGDDPFTTFTNDPLRILRGIRFLADLPLRPHPSLAPAVGKTVEKLASKPPRRIGFELKRILSSAKPWVGVKYLVDWKILPYVSQALVDSYDIKQAGEHKYNAGPQTIAALKRLKSQDHIINLAILFANVGKAESLEDSEKRSAEIARRELERLGFSKKDARRVSTMISNLKILSLESPSADDYRKIALSLDADLDRFYRFVDAYAGTTRMDSAIAEQLQSKIDRYSQVNREKDGEELRETGGVEKFDESERLMKSSINEIDTLIELVGSVNG